MDEKNEMIETPVCLEMVESDEDIKKNELSKYARGQRNLYSWYSNFIRY